MTSKRVCEGRKVWTVAVGTYDGNRLFFGRCAEQNYKIITKLRKKIMNRAIGLL